MRVIHTMVTRRKLTRKAPTAPLAKIKAYAKRIGPKGKKWFLLLKKPHSKSLNYVRFTVYRDDFPKGIAGRNKMDRAIDKVNYYGTQITGNDMWVSAANITYHTKAHMKDMGYV